MNRFHHVCEVCGRDEILSPTEAFAAGWNYPPRMGHFGTISDRLCGKCPSSKATVWWAIAEDGFTADMLTQHQAESGASSGHRGARVPGAGAALRPPPAGLTRVLSPQPTQPSDGPPPSAARTVPVIAATPISAPLPDPAPISADRSMPPVVVDLPVSVVPTSRQVEPAEPAATPAPGAALPAQTVPPAPTTSSISAVPVPAPESSITVAVSRLLASLSDALSGNTVPADAAVGMMSEVVRRGRFAPAMTAAGPVAAATTIPTATTLVEVEKMTIAPSSAGRIVYDRRASGGSAVAITGSGAASATVNVPTATTGLVIRAKVSGGSPNMTLSLDGVAVTTVVVSSTGWTDYTITGNVAAGSHLLGLSTSNATTSSSLYLDRVTTMTGPLVLDFSGKTGAAPNSTFSNSRSGSGWDPGLENYTPSNTYLDGYGNLVIKAARTSSGGYTSGWVDTKNKVSMGYGTITARFKVPKGQGLWPAFWLKGADEDTTSWPTSGEIDVMELPSTTTTMYSTLHGPIASTTNTQQAQIISNLPDLSADYHNYWVRHLPNEITFGIDNTTLGTLTPNSLPAGATWVYNRPMQVLLNIAVGGPWAGAPDSTTPFPANMSVDWVRWDPPA